MVEALVALLLVLGLLQGAWWILAAQRRGLGALVERSELLSTERIVRTVLRAEAAAGVPGRDWRVPGEGVLDLRAFRGRALVCPGIGRGDSLLVRVRGWRAPDPTKDSVLVLSRNGRWSVSALGYRRREPSGCPTTGAGADEVWRLDPPVRGAVVVRFFERGSYHLTDGSLRYRRGRAGRQPLTAASLDPDASGIEALPDGRARLRVRGKDGAGGAWARPLGRVVPPANESP